jgi:hypothetical protein
MWLPLQSQLCAACSLNQQRCAITLLLSFDPFNGCIAIVQPPPSCVSLAYRVQMLLTVRQSTATPLSCVTLSATGRWQQLNGWYHTVTFV